MSADISIDFNLFNDNSEDELSCTIKEGNNRKQYVNEYMQVLLEAFRGDRTWFVSHEEVLACWKFTDPIINAWKEDKTKLHLYKADSVNIIKEANIIDI